MPDKDARSREEEYFWKKDQELIEKMRRAAADRESSAVAWHRRGQRHGSSAVGVAGLPSRRYNLPIPSEPA